MQTQSAIDPSLAALLQTAQMVTPDQTPTVAAQVAQAAQQKMQPQGIMQGMQGPQGMQGAKQDYAAAAPSMMRNMQQAQVQQMMQQAMQPQPAGIEGLPAQNMQGMQRMAVGGVVGYAGKDGSLVGSEEELEALREKIRDAFASSASPLNILGPRAGQERQRAQDIMRMLPSLEKEQMRNILGMTQRTGDTAAYQEFGPGERAEQVSSQPEAPRAPERTAAPPIAASSAGRQLAQNVNTPPQFNIDPNNPQALNALRRAAMGAGGVERQALMNKIAELESAQAPRSTVPAAPAPTGVAALAERPTYDTASIAAAGAPYMTAGEGDVKRMREAEGKRAEFEKTLPDLSAKGIAALQQRMADVEAAQASRKESLGLDRVIQQLLGRAQGAGGAARADIQFMNAQRASEEAFSQARLGNQQAQLLLEKAQQERQLGRFDRAIALEREASALMEKARDNALKARELAQRDAGAQFQGAVQMRGQDITAQTSAADRAAQAALRNMPAVEQQMAQRVMDDFMAKNPGTTLSDAYDFYRGAGKPTDRSVLTYAQAAKIVDERLSELGTQFALNKEEAEAAKKENRAPRTLAQMREDLIRKEMAMAGRSAGSAAPAAAPSTGGAVDRNNPLLK